MTEELIDKITRESIALEEAEKSATKPFEEKRADLKRKLAELDAEEKVAVASIKKRRRERSEVDYLVKLVQKLEHSRTVAVPSSDLYNADVFDVLLDKYNDHSKIDLDQLLDEELGDAKERIYDQQWVDLFKSIWPRLRVKRKTTLTLRYWTDYFGVTQSPDDDDYDSCDEKWGDPDEDDLIDDTDLCPDDRWSMERLVARYGAMDREYTDGDKEGDKYYCEKDIDVFVLSFDDEDEDENSDSE